MKAPRGDKRAARRPPKHRKPDFSQTPYVFERFWALLGEGWGGTKLSAEVWAGGRGAYHLFLLPSPPPSIPAVSMEPMLTYLRTAGATSSPPPRTAGPRAASRGGRDGAPPPPEVR